MEFFELPEPPRSPPQPRQPPGWLGPPDNVAPGVVPLELVLVNTGEVAFHLNAVLAYPTGFELTLELRARGEPDEDFDPIGWRWRMRKRRAREDQVSREIPPEVLRFGIRFADGAKVTNIGAPHAFFDEEKERPASASGPRMMNRGGGGGGASWHEQYWVHPLPPPGELAFVCEWPQQDVELTRTTIDASLILAAAARAKELWPAPDPPDLSDGSVLST